MSTRPHPPLFMILLGAVAVLFFFPLLSDPEPGQMANGLAAVMTVAMGYRFAARWRGEWAGLLAGSMLSTAFGFFTLTQTPCPDLAFTFCMLWTLDAGSRLLVERVPEELKRAALELGIAVGLGILSGGFPGILYPVLVFFLAVLWTGIRVQSLRVPWNRVMLSLGVILGIGMGIRGLGIVPLSYSLMTAWPGGSVPLIGLLPVLLGGLLPWTVFLPEVFQRWFSNRAFALKRDPTAAVLISASFLFILSLPAAMTALAILTAEAWAEELESDPMPSWIGHGLAALILGGVTAMAYLKMPGRALLSPYVPLELGLGVFILVGVWGMRRAAYAFGGVLLVQVLLLSSLAPALRELTKNL